MCTQEKVAWLTDNKVCVCIQRAVAFPVKGTEHSHKAIKLAVLSCLPEYVVMETYGDQPIIILLQVEGYFKQDLRLV